MAILEVKGLCKSYEKFSLSDVGFSLEPGYIMGFVGRNGAGKTTTIKTMLNLVRADSGEVRIFGKDMRTHESEIKQSIGVVFGRFDYYRRHRLAQIAQVMKPFYADWDDEVFASLARRFELDLGKRVCELSEGMKVKFSLALALSHKAKLLILDEPTSGLDPVSRDELLELFQRIIEPGDVSMLFSSHITSDLDKCADYITYIKDGRIVESTTRDELLDSYRIVSGTQAQLTHELRTQLIGSKSGAYGFSGLVRSDSVLPDGLSVERADLESIMIYHERKNSNESTY